MDLLPLQKDYVQDDGYRVWRASENSEPYHVLHGVMFT